MYKLIGAVSLNRKLKKILMATVASLELKNKEAKNMATNISKNKNELGDLTQFANERQLFSYTGLTPSEFSSGDTVRKGHITRQGNKRVRYILNQAAWRALKKDRDLKEFFERLHPRTGKKRAIVAVARKLIGRIRAAFKTGKPYQMNPLSLQPA